MKRTVILSLSFVVSLSLYAQRNLSLSECREMALNNDVHVKNSHLDVLASEARRNEAMAEYFPQVSVNSFAFAALRPMLEISVKDIFGECAFSSDLQAAVDYLGQEYGFSSVFTALQSGFSASVSAFQPVYAGGRIVTGNRLASLGKDAALLHKDMTVRDVLENVDKEYWRVVMLEAKVQVLDASEDFLDNLAGDVETAVGAGLALDTDLMQVMLQKNVLKKQRLSLNGGLRLAKMNLFNSIGQPYSLVRYMQDSVRPYIDDIVLSDRLAGLKPPEEYYVDEEEAVASLEEMKLLDLSVESRILERKMALGEALPQVGIGASYGYVHAMNRRFNGFVFAMVRIPLTDWGKVSYRMKRTDLTLEKARIDRDYIGSQLLLRRRSLWLDLNVAWEQVALAREDMFLAQKTAERMHEQYEAGLVTLSDLLQSRTQMSVKADALIEAKAGYLSALSSYIK